MIIPPLPTRPLTVSQLLQQIPYADKSVPNYKWSFCKSAKYDQASHSGALIQEGEPYWFYGGNHTIEETPEEVKLRSQPYQDWLEQQKRNT